MTSGESQTAVRASEPSAGQGAQSVSAEALNAIEEKLAQLEKLVRGSGRDSLTMVQSQQEQQAALKAAATRLEDVSLDVKGLIQNSWKASQQALQNNKDLEEHFAGALRDLEKRVREELSVQAQRNALRALLPAMDDMDLILAQEAKLNPNAEDSFHKGMGLVRQKFRQGMREMGFDEIPVEPGKTTYDPTAHEAVELDVAPVLLEGGDAPAGSILFLRRAGYLHNGRVFRAPQVFVKS